MPRDDCRTLHNSDAAPSLGDLQSPGTAPAEVLVSSDTFKRFHLPSANFIQQGWPMKWPIRVAIGVIAIGVRVALLSRNLQQLPPDALDAAAVPPALEKPAPFVIESNALNRLPNNSQAKHGDLNQAALNAFLSGAGTKKPNQPGKPKEPEMDVVPLRPNPTTRVEKIDGHDILISPYQRK